MEPYTDMKYSDCGCSGRCRKVSGNQNQSVRSCLDPAMQAGTTCRDWRAMLSVREVCREF